MMHSGVASGGIPDSFSAVLTGRASEGASPDEIELINVRACSHACDPPVTPWSFVKLTPIAALGE
jgi:hypothetical protein